MDDCVEFANEEEGEVWCCFRYESRSVVSSFTTLKSVANRTLTSCFTVPVQLPS